jgi:putative flippase GtrA
MSDTALILPLAARLAAFTPKGLAKFLSVGLLGLATDLTVLWLLERQGVSHQVARAVSLCVATVVTWSLNRRVTFAATGRTPIFELARYFTVALLAQGINYTVFLEVVQLEPRLPHTLAAIVGAAVATGFSYSGQRFVTFAQRRAKRA